MRALAVGLAGAAATHAAALLCTPAALAETLTVKDVTPPVAPAGSLSAREEAIIRIFEQNTYSVVNIFDVTLMPGATLSADRPEGNGTGLVWDDAGHIVTNYHVLGGALRNYRPGQGPSPPRVARVTLLGRDGYQQTFDATLVGADRTKDLAVVQISAPKTLLRPALRGDSNGLRVGQQVLAIGNPFGFDHTLTTGVVSGLGREIASAAGVIIGGGIQCDASINPGNSGGPLIDSSGRVIGLNTAIFTPTGTSAGVGFSIPIAVVNRVVPQLIEYGRIIRPALNVQIATDQVARALKVNQGALVQAVAPKSAAEAAGLQPTRRGLTGIVTGDAIIALEGRSVNKAADLSNILDDFKTGDNVTLLVRRGDNNQKVEEVQIKLEAQAGGTT